MVLHSYDYDTDFKDADLNTINIYLVKKKYKSKMPDVKYGLKVADTLSQSFKYNLDVGHNLNKYDGKTDFIFEGESWLDPGPVVDCEPKLPPDIENVDDTVQ
jgi:hypothetical protein